MNRRDFIHVSAMGAVAAVGLPLTPVSATVLPDFEERAVGNAGDGNPEVVASIALMLNGSFAGFLRGVSGGNALGEVVSVGPNGLRKAIRSNGYADLVLSITPDMSNDFFDWVAALAKGQVTAKPGRVIALNPAGTALWTLSFREAIVKQVTLPTNGSPMTVTLSPTSTKRIKGGNAPQVVRSQNGLIWESAQWTGGQGGDTGQYVQSVAFSVTWQPAQGGKTTEGVVSYSDLNLTIRAAEADQYYDWLSSTVTNDQPAPASFSLSLKGSEGTVIMTADFDKTGVYKIDSTVELGKPAVDNVFMMAKSATLAFKPSTG